MKSIARPIPFAGLAGALTGGLIALYSRSPRPVPEQVLRFTIFFVIGAMVATGIRLLLQRGSRAR